MRPAQVTLTVALVAVAVSVVAGQETTTAPPAPKVQPPPMTLVLSGKTFVAPARGAIDVEYTAPVTKREKDFVVTRFMVRNPIDKPIARLTITETWYGKDQAVLTGGKGSINGLLQPGEVQTIVIQSPFKAGMSSNNFNFTHANGTIKPVRVAKIEAPKPDAAPAGAPRS